MAASDLRARLAALPGWVWVGALVFVSTLLRMVLARRAVAPWIMPDEIVYSDLARSFAATGEFARRGHATSAYGFVYPLLISPAYFVFDAVPRAYAAVKGINAGLMSLAAVPVYLLARRVVSVRGALIATVLTLALPAMGYTATIMTENAFLPLFCATALALVRALERPTLARQGLVLGLVVVDLLTRAQAVAFLPAVVVAPLLYAAFAGHAAQLRRYLPLAVVLVGGALLAVLAEVVRGNSPFALLGAYAVTGHTHYDPVAVGKGIVYHLALIDLGLALVPLFALVLLVARARRLDLPVQAFLATTLSLSAFLLVEVAAFAVTQSGGRIEERNLFYVEPLLLVALVAWIERGMPRPRRVAVPAALVLGALPALIPFRSLLGVNTESDTHTLVVWWYLQHSLFALDRTWVVVLVCGLAVAALVLWLPRRYALVLPMLLALELMLSFKVVEGWMPWGTRGASIGALYQGITADHPDWIDRKVGTDARVTLIWNGTGPVFKVWETEFFNRSVKEIADLGVGPTPAGQFETPVHVDSRGWLRTGTGKLHAQYVLADLSNWLRGEPIEVDLPHQVGLYRTSGPVRVAFAKTGVDEDGWMRQSSTMTIFGCRPGRFLFLRLTSDPKLFHERQVVTATQNGRPVGRFVVDPKREIDPHFGPGWSLSTHPRAGVCRFSFRVSPTAVPADAIPGSTDQRRLGVRVLRADPHV
ncbi:MAG: Dolichyl-phosphate-mannose-protein mannosyltransferase [Gaiellaceae bacterium]|nr:Dolichyl-phosphate-mannose-protein mannosyltransferase [Gaiellaceae bacterium]